MRYLLSFVFAFSVIGFLQPVHAEEHQSYFGISLIRDIEIDWSDPDFGKNSGDSGLGLLYGYKFSDAIAGELFFADSQTDEHSEFSEYDLDLEILEFAIVASIPSRGAVSPFARLAYLDLEIKGDSISCFSYDNISYQCSVVNDNSTSSGSDLVFGLGLDFAVGENSAIRVQQTFGDVENVDVTYLSFGWLTRF